MAMTNETIPLLLYSAALGLFGILILIQFWDRLVTKPSQAPYVKKLTT